MRRNEFGPARSSAQPMQSGNVLRKIAKSRQGSALPAIKDINKRSARYKRNICAWLSLQQTHGRASSTR